MKSGFTLILLNSYSWSYTTRIIGVRYFKYFCNIENDVKNILFHSEIHKITMDTCFHNGIKK